MQGHSCVLWTTFNLYVQKTAHIDKTTQAQIRSSLRHRKDGDEGQLGILCWIFGVGTGSGEAVWDQHWSPGGARWGTVQLCSAKHSSLPDLHCGVNKSWAILPSQCLMAWERVESSDLRKALHFHKLWSLSKWELCHSKHSTGNHKMFTWKTLWLIGVWGDGKTIAQNETKPTLVLIWALRASQRGEGDNRLSMWVKVIQHSSA